MVQPEDVGQRSSDLCAPFVRSLPIAGASIAVVTASGTRLTVCSSDPTAARIDELQFELGEGPQWAAARSGEFVVLDDVAARGHDDWPMFGAALRELPVGALFSVPIRMGAVVLGVASLYAATPRVFTADQHATSLAIASAVAGSVVQQALQSVEDDSVGDSTASPALRREVHQATGMILVQLNTTATDAYARLQAYAFANSRTVQEVAQDVVVGSIVFSDGGS